MNLAAEELGTVHSSDSRVGILSLVECDESKSSWLTAVRVVHDLRFLDLLVRMLRM